MKKIAVLLLSTLLTVVTSVTFAKGPKNDDEGTVEILHKPEDQAIIIRVSINALDAHIRHGDCVFDGSGEEPPPAAKPEVDDAPICEDIGPPPA